MRCTQNLGGGSYAHIPSGDLNVDLLSTKLLLSKFVLSLQGLIPPTPLYRFHYQSAALMTQALHVHCATIKDHILLYRP